MQSFMQWQAAFDNRSPIYSQIVGQFARAVSRGDLAPGSRVPSIRDLSVALKVNANTVQRAYQEMERAGVIFSQRGTGFFVVEEEGIAQRIRSEMAKDTTRRYLEEMRSFGFDDAQTIAEIKVLMVHMRGGSGGSVRSSGSVGDGGSGRSSGRSGSGESGESGGSGESVGDGGSGRSGWNSGNGGEGQEGTESRWTMGRREAKGDTAKS